MPKQLSDKDRILAFAFRASVPELEEAKAVIDAALRAKKGGSRSVTKPKTSAKPKGLPKVEDSEAEGGTD